MIDPSRSGRGGCCLLHLVDLIQDGVEVDREFDGVLPPESASFAGQAAISRPLACQSTPEPVAGPISLSGTAGPAACGETGMVGSLSGPVVAIRSGPIVPIRPRRASGIRFFLGGIMGGRTSSEKP